MDAVMRRNLAAMFLLQGANYAVPLITFPYLARTLGAVQFGVLGLSAAVIGYFLLLVDWGFSLSATQQVAKSRTSPASLSDIFWNTLVAKTIFALITFVFMVVACMTTTKLGQIKPVLFASWFCVVGNLLNVNWFLQGIERIGRFAMLSILCRFITVPFTYWLVSDQSDSWVAAAIQAGSTILIGLVSLHQAYQSKCVSSPKFSWLGAVREIKNGSRLFFSTAAINLYTNTNTIILNFIAGSAAVGNYAGADKIRAAAQGAFSPITPIAYTRINFLITQSREEAFSFARRLLLLQSGAAFVLSMVMFIFAESIILLVLGSDFQLAIPILRWLVWLPFIVSISNVLGIQIMLPLGMKSEYTRTLIYVGFFNILVIGPLVLLYGAVGAAISMFISELLVTLLMAYQLRKKKIALFSPRKDLCNV